MDDFISVMGDQMQRLINHFGELVVNKLTGVLIATDGGAFGIAGPGRAFGLAPRTLGVAQSSRRSEPFAATRTLTDGY
jgi:hypothetical protein